MKQQQSEFFSVSKGNSEVLFYINYHWNIVECNDVLLKLHDES